MMSSTVIIEHIFFTVFFYLQGAKMHFLDGFDKASYMKNQVRLLSHSINRVKYAPRTWLMTHPYIIADRFVVNIHF